MHSCFQPSIPEARAISTLWWCMLALATLIYLAVITGLLVALRARRADRGHSTSGAGDSRRSRVPAIAAFTTLAIVAGFWIATVSVESRTNRMLRTPLGIAVPGHEGWWEITYDVGDTAAPVRTANELHIPVGQA